MLCRCSLVDQGAQDSVSCPYLLRWRQIKMPVLCLTIDNSTQPHFQLRGSCGCFLLALRQSGWGSPRRPPCSTIQLSPELCVLIQVTTQTEGPGSRLSSHLIYLCVCGQEGGQRLPPPTQGSGQHPWQEKARGRLAVDFLLCRWGGWRASEHMGLSLPLESDRRVNAEWCCAEKPFLCMRVC